MSTAPKFATGDLVADTRHHLYGHTWYGVVLSAKAGADRQYIKWFPRSRDDMELVENLYPAVMTFAGPKVLEDRATPAATRSSTRPPPASP